jgi:hypothetical protein
LGEVQIVHSPSPDKMADTIIFRNMVAAVGGAKGSPLVDKRIITLDIALDGTGQELIVPHIVRGFVSKTANANPTLLIQAAGDATLVDLSKHGANKSDFAHTFQVKIPASGSYHITLVVIADRTVDSPELNCFLSVDTLDMDLSKGKLATKPAAPGAK